MRYRNLNEYDTGYLEALINSDVGRIVSYETAAASQGYGPLVPCNVTDAARGQKQLCRMSI